MRKKIVIYLRTNVYTRTYLSGDYVLVHWPNEDLVSVVNKRNVIEPSSPSVAKACQVKMGKNTYDGVIAAIGMYRCMKAPLLY